MAQNELHASSQWRTFALCVRKAPGHYSMTGLAEKDEVEEVLGIKMPEGDYNSIGGFMCMTIDRIPLVGEAATVETASDKIRFEVSKVDERRVMQVEAFLSGKGTVEQEEAQDDEAGVGEASKHVEHICRPGERKEPSDLCRVGPAGRPERE